MTEDTDPSAAARRELQRAYEAGAPARHELERIAKVNKSMEDALGINVDSGQTVAQALGLDKVRPARQPEPHLISEELGKAAAEATRKQVRRDAERVQREVDQVKALKIIADNTVLTAARLAEQATKTEEAVRISTEQLQLQRDEAEKAKTERKAARKFNWWLIGLTVLIVLLAAATLAVIALTS